MLHCDPNFTDICSQRSSEQEVASGADKYLAMNHYLNQRTSPAWATCSHSSRIRQSGSFQFWLLWFLIKFQRLDAVIQNSRRDRKKYHDTYSVKFHRDLCRDKFCNCSNQPDMENILVYFEWKILVFSKALNPCLFIISKVHWQPSVGNFPKYTSIINH